MSQQIPLLKMATGNPSPLGASRSSADDGDSWNFALFAPDASGVTLCLYQRDTEEPLAEVAITSRTGAIWHLNVSGITEGTL